MTNKQDDGSASNAAVGPQKVGDPITNAMPPQSNDGMDLNGTFHIGQLSLKILGDGVEIKNDKVGARDSIDPKGTRTGFNANGEMKLDPVTLSVGADGIIYLRRENTGARTEVDRAPIIDLLESLYFANSKKGNPDTIKTNELSIGSALDEAFFCRKIGSDGNVKSRLEDVKKNKD